MEKELLLTATEADRIDKMIQEKRPETLTDLLKIAKKAGHKYTVQRVKYMGFYQGVRLCFVAGSKRYVRPKRGLVYAVSEKL